MLHKDDDLQNAKAKIPQHVALPVNMRKVDTLTLGENCMHKDDSLVNQLRKEKEKNEDEKIHLIIKIILLIIFLLVAFHKLGYY